MRMRILVRRMGALGDVVLTTPIVRRLRRENPDAEIGVQTAYPDVYRNSPHRLTVFQPGPLPYPWTPEGGLDHTIALDLAYERRPDLHIVQAFMLAAFDDEGDPADHRQELFPAGIAPFFDGTRVIAVHAAKAGWRSRTLPEATWVAVTEGIRNRGLFPLMVGSMRDALPKAKAAAFHSHDILAQMRMIEKCACFIGSDSGLTHVAGASDVPIVCAFTSVLPALRMPRRYGRMNWRFEAVVPDLDCIGCLARAPVPTTTEPPCERSDYACTYMATAGMLLAAMDRLLGQA